MDITQSLTLIQKARGSVVPQQTQKVFLSHCGSTVGELEARSHNNIAATYYHLGDNEQALEGYQKARVIYESTLGLEHPKLVGVYRNIAMVYNQLGQYDEAAKWGLRR